MHLHTDLLHHPAAVHLQRQLLHPTFHLIGENLFLSLIAVLEELLNHVISENVHHQLICIGLDLAEYALLLVAVGALQFQLYEA